MNVLHWWNVLSVWQLFVVVIAKNRQDNCLHIHQGQHISQRHMWQSLLHIAYSEKILMQHGSNQIPTNGIPPIHFHLPVSPLMLYTTWHQGCIHWNIYNEHSQLCYTFHDGFLWFFLMSCRVMAPCLILKLLLKENLAPVEKAATNGFNLC